MGGCDHFTNLFLVKYIVSGQMLRQIIGVIGEIRELTILVYWSIRVLISQRFAVAVSCETLTVCKL